MSALICAKVHGRWYADTQRTMGEKPPESDGPEWVKSVLEHTTLRSYTELTSALLNTLPMVTADYLQIWQQGGWRTICLD